MSTKDERIERLAELEHEQWVEWSQEIAKKETLSQERLDRWKKLWVPYKDLTELEKEADRAWARRVKEKMSKKRKPDIYLFIAIIGLLLMITLITYGSYTIGKNQYRAYTYDMCRSFDFITYLHIETIRHYQNASFEVSQMPNCEAYYHPLAKQSLTYEEWLTQNNLKHINWTTNQNETKGGNQNE